MAETIRAAVAAKLTMADIAAIGAGWRALSSMRRACERSAASAPFTAPQSVPRNPKI
jgi:hypothetical protein